MKGSRKFWLTGSAFVVLAAVVAALAIPVGASAKTTHPAAAKHCKATNDNMIDASQYANNQWVGTASSSACDVTVSGSFTKGAIIKPVVVVSKLTVAADGSFTGTFHNKIFAGSVQGKLSNPATTHPGTYRFKVHVCVDIDPPSLIITIEF